MVFEIEVLHTILNPQQQNLPPAEFGSWTDSVVVARALTPYHHWWPHKISGVRHICLYDNQSRHLWIGLSDENGEDDYRWHDGTPFHYRNWGDGQPSDSETENFANYGNKHGNIMPGTEWLVRWPTVFPSIWRSWSRWCSRLCFTLWWSRWSRRYWGWNTRIFDSITITALVNTPDTDGIQFITMLGDHGWGLYINDGNWATQVNTPFPNILTLTQPYKKMYGQRWP